MSFPSLQINITFQPFTYDIQVGSNDFQFTTQQAAATTNEEDPDLARAIEASKVTYEAENQVAKEKVIAEEQAAKKKAILEEQEAKEKAVAEEQQKKVSQPNLSALSQVSSSQSKKEVIVIDSEENKPLSVEDLLKQYTDEVTNDLKRAIVELTNDQDMCPVIAESIAHAAGGLKPEFQALFNSLTKSVITSFEMSNGEGNLDIVTLATKRVLLEKISGYAEAVGKISPKYLTDLASVEHKSALRARTDELIVDVKKMSQKDLMDLATLLLLDSETQEKELDQLSDSLPKVATEILNFLIDVEGKEEHPLFLALFTKEIESLLQSK